MLREFTLPSRMSRAQGGEFAPTSNYSPMFNDIWSLGIIPFDLATGCNLWKSVTPCDPTFQAYLCDPFNFLLSALPISHEVNAILVRNTATSQWISSVHLPLTLLDHPCYDFILCTLVISFILFLYHYPMPKPSTLCPMPQAIDSFLIVLRNPMPRL